MAEMDIVDENANSKAPINPKDSLPWVEKYRPNSLEELIAHEEIIQILNKLIESNKLPHLLFHGPPGTGMSYSSPKKLRNFYIQSPKKLEALQP
jgi:replication factor C subunit 3/5